MESVASFTRLVDSFESRTSAFMADSGKTRSCDGWTAKLSALPWRPSTLQPAKLPINRKCGIIDLRPEKAHPVSPQPSTAPLQPDPGRGTRGIAARRLGADP
jgi:hypothetical protein